MLSEVSNILNDLNAVLLPEVCFGCNVRLFRGERLLCTVCRHNLPLTEYDFNVENEVDRIFYGRIDVKKASSFLYYTENGIVKTLIHYLKYRDQQQIGTFLGDWYGQVLRSDPGLDKIHAVVPVPLHKRKLRKRGYNQVDGFARQLACHLKADFIPDALVKTANTKTQTRKGRMARWLGNRSLYLLRDPGLLQGKSVLLVDDVITTGATMEGCARALKTAGGVTLYLAGMATVPRFR